MTGKPFDQRRRFLQAAGVGLALPLLDRFASKAVANGIEEPPKRSVFICSSLGFHGPNVFPEQTGTDYEAPKYLKLLEEHRKEFTVFSGLSHPDQGGADGHSSQKTWLTSARHPGLGGFRNTVSVDQLAAEKLGYVTRFPSLILGTHAGSQSYTRSGVMIPANPSPSKVFAQLFLKGTDKQIKKQVQKLKDGQSILDAVANEAKQLQKRSSAADRDRLNEYFTSVREMENRLSEAESWVQKPKPVVEAKPPKDISDATDLIGRMRLLFDLVPLALQTDSTRVISLLVHGRNDVPKVPGVSIDHHNLSHHGQDEEKIRQLELIESAEFKAFGELIGMLKDKQEAGKRLIDSTSVVFGSNLGNANSHDWHNLPVLLAGGDFKHGQHVAYDKDNNTPFANLFLTMLQKQGLEVDQFGSSTGTLTL
jgi:hypothetical protein